MSRYDLFSLQKGWNFFEEQELYQGKLVLIFQISVCWHPISQSVRSVAQSCPNLCDPMNCSIPGLPVHHQLPKLAHTHVHRVGDTIQPSHPLFSPSPPTFNLSQHQGLFQWVSSSHRVAKVLEFQLQHQSFQWIFRTDFLQDGLFWSPCSPRDSQESSPTPESKSISPWVCVMSERLSIILLKQRVSPLSPDVLFL